MLSSAIKLSQGNGKSGGGKPNITPASKIENHATIWDRPQGYETFSHEINPKWDQQVTDPSLLDLFQDMNAEDQGQDQDLIDLDDDHADVLQGLDYTAFTITENVGYRGEDNASQGADVRNTDTTSDQHMSPSDQHVSPGKSTVSKVLDTARNTVSSIASYVTGQGTGSTKPEMDTAEPGSSQKEKMQHPFGAVDKPTKMMD